MTTQGKHTGTVTVSSVNTTYNGWRNYETWVVNLWLGNESSSYKYWLEQTLAICEGSEQSGHFTSKEQAQLSLAEMLKSEHEAALPELDGFAADLLNAAMGEVDWHEIAEGLVNACVEQNPDVFLKVEAGKQGGRR